jgi:periplasmic protein TonB
MPHDLFADVTDPSIHLGAHKWYSVPLSFLVHTAVLVVFVVAPLVATGVLPMPHSGPVIINLAPPPLPSPPPVRRAPSPGVMTNRDAAPVRMPDAITPEPALAEPFESNGPATGFVDLGIIEGETAVVAPPPTRKEMQAATKTVHVGGSVKTPQRLTYVAPTYPPIALAARVQGIVIVQATVAVDGSVQDVQVLRSDSPLLNEAAIEAVRRWSYTPTLLNGIPVSVIMTVTVQFRM